MKLHIISKYLIFALSIPTIYLHFFPRQVVVSSILCAYPILMLLFFTLLQTPPQNLSNRNLIRIFIILNIVLFIRGLIDASSYQDWTTILSVGVCMFIFLPLSIYFGTDNKSIVILLKYYIVFGIALSLLVYKELSGHTDHFIRMIAPICLFLLIMPFLHWKYQIVICAIAFFSFVYNIENRSNMLNISVALSISLTYYFRRFFMVDQVMKALRLVLLVAPLIFLALGITGVFNVFQISRYTGDYIVSSDNGNEQDLVVDSRTSIYMDVFKQLQRDNAKLFGLGGSGKTETSLVDVSYADFDEEYKEGRRGTESGMLNFIQYGGIVGGLIYFLLFFQASYQAMYKTNNWFFMMLGLWVAYKGMYSFVEDRLGWGLAPFFLFLSIGLCFNTELKQKSNEEIKEFFRSIFHREPKTVEKISFMKKLNQLNE